MGSLTTAVASFCHIKSLGGQWLVRIEDVDFERCKNQYTTSILYDLENLGLYTDQEIVYQSRRLPIYQEFLDGHLAEFVYDCTCSRKTLAAYFATHDSTPYQAQIQHTHLNRTQDLYMPPIYPRLCLNQAKQQTNNAKVRLVLPDVLSAFYDGICGVIWDNPAKSLGDVVVRRQNGMINYVLACAIDDGLQNITHVMRGLDILPMTIAQIHIIGQCQLPLPQRFYHLPLLHNHDGQKLSKQNLATPIDTKTPKNASKLLITALRLLGQTLPADMLDGTPSEILRFASNHWDNAPLRHKRSLGIAH